MRVEVEPAGSLPRRPDYAWPSCLPSRYSRPGAVPRPIDHLGHRGIRSLARERRYFSKHRRLQRTSDTPRSRVTSLTRTRCSCRPIGASTPTGVPGHDSTDTPKITVRSRPLTYTLV